MRNYRLFAKKKCCSRFTHDSIWNWISTWLIFSLVSPASQQQQKKNTRKRKNPDKWMWEMFLFLFLASSPHRWIYQILEGSTRKKMENVRKIESFVRVFWWILKASHSQQTKSYDGEWRQKLIYWQFNAILKLDLICPCLAHNCRSSDEGSNSDSNSDVTSFPLSIQLACTLSLFWDRLKKLPKVESRLIAE